MVVGELVEFVGRGVHLPLAEAKKQLKRIHGIGDPGAEKILLLTRSYPVLGLDSNGVRVLTRLGYGTGGKTYAATYKSATTARSPSSGGHRQLIDAHLVLRHHGQAVCKTSTPRCAACVDQRALSECTHVA